MDHFGLQNETTLERGTMEIKQYTRKPFPVSAVQVTLQNIQEVAEWCKGTIEYRPTRMMGTTTDLPIIRLKGQGDNRGKEFEAALGCWVVELKGSFRSYKPAQFDASFDEIVIVKDHLPDEACSVCDDTNKQLDIESEGTPELLQEAEEFADVDRSVETLRSAGFSADAASSVESEEMAENSGIYNSGFRLVENG